LKTLELHNIFKNYEGMPLLQGVSFSIAEGETVCLLGSSGSGKSTLLRIIAGLETADGGEVFWEGKNLQDVPVHRRNFGLMFQDYALFPNRNVAGNVAFGLRMQGVLPDEINKRVDEALQQVNMQAFAQRKVTDLSGGEQQRVALARALAPSPRLLMLDEPLGALDRALREQLSEELRRLLHRAGIPALYVTHDQEEAFTIADRLILLNHGRIVQEGTPDEVYNHPVSAWVAGFLGLSNLLAGEIVSQSPLKVQTPAGTFELAQSEQMKGMAIGSKVTILLKPGGAMVAPMDRRVENCLRVRVEDVIFRGEGFRCDVACGVEPHFRFIMDRPLKTGEEVDLFLPPESILCMADEA
jgi:spermidine/putrescine transport system ATP-binding protein